MQRGSSAEVAVERRRGLWIIAGALMIAMASMAVVAAQAAPSGAVSARSAVVHLEPSTRTVIETAANVATSGYPGPIARPGIHPGPSVGTVCGGGSAAPNYVCGFMPGSQVTFEVDGVVVGTARAENNGCVGYTIHVSNDASLTIETFGSNGPKSLGPVKLHTAVASSGVSTGNIGPIPSGYGNHTMIVKGIGGPGPYRDKEVGLSEAFTVSQCGTTTTTPNGGGGGLAFTGAQIAAASLIGAALLVAGGILVVTSRRRRRRQGAPPSQL